MPCFSNLDVCVITFFQGMVDERYHAGLCYTIEEFFQDPAKPWSSEMNGWFRVDLQYVNMKGGTSIWSVLMGHKKVGTEQFESIR